MFPFALDEKVNCLSWYLVLVWYTLTEYFSPRRRRKKLSFPVEQWKSHCWLKNWSAENPFLFVFQPDSSSFEILFQVKPKNYPVKTTVSKFHILPNIIKIEIFQIVLHLFAIPKIQIFYPKSNKYSKQRKKVFHIDRSPRYNPSNYKPVEENSRKPSSWPTFFLRIIVWEWEAASVVDHRARWGGSRKISSISGESRKSYRYGEGKCTACYWAVNIFVSSSYTWKRWNSVLVYHLVYSRVNWASVDSVSILFCSIVRRDVA